MEFPKSLSKPNLERKEEGPLLPEEFFAVIESCKGDVSSLDQKNLKRLYVTLFPILKNKMKSLLGTFKVVSAAEIMQELWLEVLQKIPRLYNDTKEDNPFHQKQYKRVMVSITLGAQSIVKNRLSRQLSIKNNGSYKLRTVSLPDDEIDAMATDSESHDHLDEAYLKDLLDGVRSKMLSTKNQDPEKIILWQRLCDMVQDYVMQNKTEYNTDIQLDLYLKRYVVKQPGINKNLCNDCYINTFLKLYRTIFKDLIVEDYRNSETSLREPILYILKRQQNRGKKLRRLLGEDVPFELPDRE
jgi:hypothetical protein